jgi:hypothetical protein
VSSIIADALEDMKIQTPKPTVDIEQVRKLYHQTEEAENGKAGKKKKKAKGEAAAASAPPSVQS